MKFNKILAITAFTITASTSICANASTNIAVVNYVEIENKSLVSKDITKQMQDRQVKHQAEIKSIQEDVQKKVADLEKSSYVLTVKALEAKKTALQKELVQIDSNLKAKSEKLEAIKNNTLISLNSKIKEITAAIAKKQGYDLVISENTVVYSSEKIDITNEVIKELDAKTPKMKINWEETSAKKKK